MKVYHLTKTLILSAIASAALLLKGSLYGTDFIDVVLSETQKQSADFIIANHQGLGVAIPTAQVKSEATYSYQNCCDDRCSCGRLLLYPQIEVSVVILIPEVEDSVTIGLKTGDVTPTTQTEVQGHENCHFKIWKDVAAQFNSEIEERVGSFSSASSELETKPYADSIGAQAAIETIGKEFFDSMLEVVDQAGGAKGGYCSVVNYYHAILDWKQANQTGHEGYGLAQGWFRDTWRLHHVAVDSSGQPYWALGPCARQSLIYDAIEQNESSLTFPADEGVATCN